jgi:hypothetical protein
MHFPSSASVVSTIAAMATLATCLPTDDIPAHQLVQRDDPICGWAYQKSHNIEYADIPGGNSTCLNFSNTTVTDFDGDNYIVAFNSTKCEWCEIFS